MDAVALLRGMNVGGHRLTNQRLIEVVTGLGLPEAIAYQASGNVLFSAGERSLAELENVLEHGLEAALGYPVPVMMRSAIQITEVLAAQPHGDPSRQPGGKPQIAFFKTELSSAAARQIEAVKEPGDLLTVLGHEIHWWPNAGIADSEIDWGAIDRQHGPSTMRTRGTIERIAKKLRA